MTTAGIRQTCLVLAAGVLWPALAAPVWAQNAVHVLPQSSFAAPAYPHYGYGYGYGYSSTLFEGVLRGRADVVRASGEAAVLWAEAERKHQDAVRLSLENSVRRLQVRHERERMGLAHRLAVQELRRNAAEARRASRTGSAVLPVKSVLADAETRASNKVDLGRSLLERGRELSARRWFENVVAEFPETEAAVEAQQLLAGLAN
jgi:hypothetical protein